MIIEHTAKDGTRSYMVRVGRRPAKTFSEADWGSRKRAKAEALKHEGELLAGSRPPSSITAEKYAERVLAHWEREKLRSGNQRKSSTTDTLRYNARGFVESFGSRLVAGGVARGEARDWALEAPAGQVKFATQLYNRAIEEGLVSVNPFRGLTPTSKGRSELAPPTLEEFDRLLEGWRSHGSYMTMGRSLTVFAAFTGIRPGELFALEWDDVDFDRMRIHVRRRLYDGELDLPKSNKPRTIVLTPAARDALLPLERVANTVFVGKRGDRLSAPKLSGYWAVVRAASGVDHAFYLATRHRFAWDAYVIRGISRNAIAQQMGWSESAVEHLLSVYGHGDQGWEAEVDRAFGANVQPLREVV